MKIPKKILKDQRLKTLPSAPLPNMLSQGKIDITVIDPVKAADKYGTGYISYTVASNANRKGFLAGGMAVTRRYNDFSWLSKELAKHFPGVIVPPIPAKQTFGNSSEIFIETRRRALEKFLQRVSDHHLLGYSDIFIIFLESDEEHLLAIKTSAEEKDGGKKSMAERASRYCTH